MSQPAPPRAKGPREQQLDWVWGEIWKELHAGGVWSFFYSEAERDLARFKETLPPNDPAAADDVDRAERVHRSQKEHFTAALRVREDERNKILSFREKMLEQVLKVSMFTMQSLALANGSAVLATLTYIGRDGAGPASPWLIAVISLGAIGFCLTLLSAHIASRMAMKPIGLLLDMAAIHISTNDLIAKRDQMVAAANRITWWTYRLSYSAAGCLVLGLVCGLLYFTGFEGWSWARHPGPSNAHVLSTGDRIEAKPGKIPSAR